MPVYKRGDARACQLKEKKSRGWCLCGVVLCVEICGRRLCLDGMFGVNFIPLLFSSHHQADDVARDYRLFHALHVIIDTGFCEEETIMEREKEDR